MLNQKQWEVFASMSIEFDNCPRCGAIYQRNYRKLCNKCVSVIENEYKKCNDYLHRYSKTTIEEMSNDLEISINRIIRFIKERRLFIEQAPNFFYPCRFCYEGIKRGYLCRNCCTKMSMELKNITNDSIAYDANEEYVKSNDNKKFLHEYKMKKKFKVNGEDNEPDKFIVHNPKKNNTEVK
jgi:uncharacterized C2H2 Zn-finger protein